MKKVLLLMALALAFTFTAMAQTEGKAGGASGQTTETKAKKSKKASAATESGQAGMAKEAGAAKESTLTGCLSAQPDKDGNYTVSNGRYKKGVEVGPADTVKEHAGHQVKLTGNWSTAAGEQPGGGKKKGKKSFQVTNVTHIAETCEKAPGGGTTSEKPAGKTAEGKPKKGEKKSETPPPPKS
jgi:hypothetical protein